MLPSTELYITVQRYGTEVSTDICPRTSSVPRCENCELRGTDNVQGQISVLIFFSEGTVTNPVI